MDQRNESEDPRVLPSPVTREAWYQTLMATAMDWVWEVDTQGRIVYSSPVAEKILGMQPDELIGRFIFEFVVPEEREQAKARFARIVKQRKVNAKMRIHFKHKDGSLSYLHTVLRPYADSQNNLGFHGVCESVEKYEARTRLWRSKSLYRAAFEQSAVGLMLADFDGYVRQATPAPVAILGLDSPDDILNTLGFERMFPEERHALLEVRAGILAGETCSRVAETRAYRKDGQPMWTRNTVSPIVDKRGNPYAIILVEDITERKEAEHALRESEERYRSLVELSPLAITVLQGEKIVYVNPAAVELAGAISEENLVGAPIHTFVHPEFLEEALGKMHELLEEEGTTRPFETTLLRLDGNAINVEMMASYVVYRGKPAVLTMARDITERRRAEQHLAELSRLKDQLLVKGSLNDKLLRITDGVVEILGADFARIWLIKEGDICETCPYGATAVGPVVCRDRGICLHLVTSSGRYTHTDGGHRRVPIGAFKIGRVAAGEVPKYVTNDVVNDPHVHDHEWARKLGLVSFAAFQLVVGEDKPAGVIGLFSTHAIAPYEEAMLEDLARTTSQVILAGTAEESLRESQEKYRRLVEDVSDWVWETDENAVFTYASPRVRDILGYEPEEVVGRRLVDIIAPDGADRAWQAPYATDERGMPIFPFLRKVLCKDGTQAMLELSGAPVFDERGAFRGHRGTARDVTDRVRAEEALKDRLELERLVSTISASFVNMPVEQIDTGMNHALQVLGESMGVDRCELLLFRNGETWLDSAYEWCADGVESQMHNQRGIPVFETRFFNRLVETTGAIVVTRIDDLPAEARAERELMKTQSMRSLLTVPMVFQGKRLGQLGFVSTRSEKIWSPETVTLLKFVGEILVNALERKRAEEALNSRLGLERVFTAIATELFNLPLDRIDAGIQRAIQLAGEYMGVDRCIVRLIDEAETGAYAAYEWHAEGIRPLPPALWKTSRRDFLWIAEIFEAGRPFVVSKVDELPEEAQSTKRTLQELGVKSALSVPMLHHGKLIGFVGFESLTREREWTEEGLTLLRVVGEMLLNILERRRGEQALRQSQERYRGLVEDVSDLVYESDENGVFTYVSPRCRDIFSYEPEEAVGHRPVDFAVPEDAERMTRVVESVLRDHTALPTTIFAASAKDGTRTEIEVNATPVFDDEHNFRGHRGIIRNITERRKAEEAIRASEERYRLLFEQSPDMVFVMKDQRFVAMNPAATRVLDYKAEDLIGQSPLCITSEVQPDGLCIEEKMEWIEKNLREKGLCRFEWAHTRKDGSIIECESSAVRYEMHGEQFDQVITRDITERKRAEEARERLAAIVEGTSDYASIADTQQHVLYINRGGRLMLGVGENEDLQNLDIADVHPAWAARIICGEGIPTAVRDGTWSGETALLNRSGDEIPVSQVIVAHRTQDGSVDFLATTMRDLTQRKRDEEALARSEERFKQVAESAGEMIWEMDACGLFTYISPVVDKMMGYAQEEVVGKMHAFDLLAPEMREESLDAIAEMLAKQEPFRGFVSAYLHKNGGRIVLESSGTPVFDDQGLIAGYRGVSTDITQRKQAEDEIRELTRSLERRVTERTARLEEANKELEAFTYSVSHDLRAPLRSIDGFSLAVLEDYSDKLDATGQDYLNRVRESTQRMGHLIDDLLRLSRVTRAEMRRERVNLSNMARAILADLHSATPERELEFVIQPDIVVEGDPELLRIALRNLLDNAWKFTSRKAAGMIELGMTRVDGENVYIVRDNGVGFDMAYADKLFTPFQRLHSEAEFPGTGIGLAIVKRIIGRHEGRVWAEGGVDQGATFYFTLSN